MHFTTLFAVELPYRISLFLSRPKPALHSFYASAILRIPSHTYLCCALYIISCSWFMSVILHLKFFALSWRDKCEILNANCQPGGTLGVCILHIKRGNFAVSAFSTQIMKLKLNYERNFFVTCTAWVRINCEITFFNIKF